MPTMSLTIDAAAAQRVAAAFGRYWHLTNPDGTPRDATVAEVRTFLVRQLRGVVRAQETAAAHAEAEQALTDVDVT